MTLVIVFLTNVNGFAQRRGNGNLVTNEIAVSSFERINVIGDADVRFHLADEHRVVVTIDENLVEYLNVVTRNSTLSIGFQSIETRRGNIQRANHRFTKFVVDVYSPLVTNVRVTGSGSFTAVDKIVTPRFEATITGSGNVNGTFEVENFIGRITGSGNINVSGTAENNNVTITGSGNFNGNELHSQNAVVRITGSGNANVYAVESLNARTTGSGRVIYRGNPNVVNVEPSEGIRRTETYTLFRRRVVRDTPVSPNIISRD